ncbi:MAG: hypothetical protein JXA67_09345, partial [Micromonosporaceae bacterium]|nr:hypothetical protein [Micromonosporaceae bacterium]
GTAAGYTVEDPALGWTWHYAQPEGVASVEGLYPLVALTDRLGHRIDVLYAPSGMIAELRHTGGYRILVDTAGGRITGLHLGTGTPSEAPGSAPVPAPESNPGPAPASPSGSTPEQTPEPTPEPQLLVRFAYDSAGNLSEVIDPERASQRFTYDAAGRMTTWADRNGSRYRYTYNVSGRCIRTNGPDGFMSARFIYGSGTTTLIDSLGHRTVYHLDGRGKVTKTADPLGNTAQRRFDENDQLIEAIDPLGRATTYTRDSNGDIVAIRRPDGRNAIVRYTALRQPAMVAGFDQSVWQREYDEIGNLLTATGPDGATIRYTYDGCGHLATITDPLGATTVVSCDAAGLPLRVTDPTGATTAYRRDHAGRVVAITDPLGATTRLTYTVDGKITSRTLPDGTAETWEYDGEGNLTAHTGPTGAATRFEYTHFDLPAARIEPDGTRLAFGYDSELRLTSVTNPQGLVWSYEYDPAGRLVAETDFNSRRLAYTIDAAGQLTSKVNGLRQTLSFEYDSLGHLVAKYTPEGVTRYAYDPAGRLLRAQAPGSDLAITRDALGRIVAETINGQTLHTTRDVLGRVAERRTPSGVTSTWTYDARHQPSSLTAAGHTMRFTHDAAGRQVGRHVAGEGPWLRFDQSFDPADRLLSQTVTAGLSDRPDAAASAPWELARRTYTYRADGALTAIDDATTGRRTLALDQAGRVTAVQAAAWSERYAYDSAGNLVHASSGASSGGSPGASSGAGQGDHGTAPDREFEYSGTLVRRAGNVRYQHDAGGRVALKQRPRHSAKPDTWYYTWDSEDRLTAVRVPDGTWWTYRYDPLGRRISKRHLTSDGQVLEQTGYAWEGTRLAEQTRYPGGGLPWVTTTFDYQVESHVPIAQTTTSPGQAAHGRPGPQREASWAIARPDGPDGPGYADGPRADLPTPAPLPTTQEEFDQRFYAIVTDLVGTPTELVSPGEGIAWQARATIWGTTAAVSPAGVDCPLRFPGQYYDPETQDHYNFFRYYDPATGRYQSPDPIGLIGGSDPHQYVPNPTGWIDPLGLSPCTSQGDSFEGPGPWDLRGRDPMSVVPDHASVRELTPVPGGSQYGLEFKWVDSQGRTVRLRIHGPDASAPPGSHSASGETYRIQISGRYQDEAGNLYHKNVHNPASPFYDPTAANATHIPWPPGYVGL